MSSFSVADLRLFARKDNDRSIFDPRFRWFFDLLLPLVLLYALVVLQLRVMIICVYIMCGLSLRTRMRITRGEGGRSEINHHLSYTCISALVGSTCTFLYVGLASSAYGHFEILDNHLWHLFFMLKYFSGWCGGIEDVSWPDANPNKSQNIVWAYCFLQVEDIPGWR